MVDDHNMQEQKQEQEHSHDCKHEKDELDA